MIDGFIDPIPVRRVGAAATVWFHANALLPQPEAFEHLLDHLPFVNEGHNTHLALAVGTDEWVGLPDFLDEVPPFLGRNTAGLVFGHVDDLHALCHLFGLFLLLGAFLALAAHLIGIPAVVAHELKALVGDVLGDGGDKVAGGEDLKVAMDLGVHAGAVDDGAVLVHGVGRLEFHFLGRERVADDIPCDTLQILAFVGHDAAAAVNVEAGVFPLLEHASALGRQEALLAEEGDEFGAEQPLHRIHSVLGKAKEAFVAQEQSVGHQQVQMGMEVEVFAEGVNGHDDAGHALRLFQGDAHDITDTLLGDAAEVFEQIAVVPEIRTQHLRDGEGHVAVGNREEDGLGEQGSEELYLFLVAGGTKPTALAGEGEQVVFLAVVTADSGEAPFQVPAVHELVHHLGDDGAQKAVTGLIPLFIHRLKAVEMPGKALPEGRCPWLSRTINLRNHAPQRTEGAVSNSGTPPKKV